MEPGRLWNVATSLIRMTAAFESADSTEGT
jgi:hypothetical protein